MKNLKLRRNHFCTLNIKKKFKIRKRFKMRKRLEKGQGYANGGRTH